MDLFDCESEEIESVVCDDVEVGNDCAERHYEYIISRESFVVFEKEVSIKFD